MKRSVGVMRRAEVQQSRMRLSVKTILQRHRQSRRADPWLALQQDHSAFPGRRLLPAAHQKVQLLFTAHQWRKGCLVLRFEAAPNGTYPRHLPCLHGIGQPLERCLAQIAVLERAARKTPSNLRDHDMTRLSKRLKTSTNIRGLPNDALFLCSAFPDEITDHPEPRGDADTNL